MNRFIHTVSLPYLYRPVPRWQSCIIQTNGTFLFGKLEFAKHHYHNRSKNFYSNKSLSKVVENFGQCLDWKPCTKTVDWYFNMDENHPYIADGDLYPKYYGYRSCVSRRVKKGKVIKTIRSEKEIKERPQNIYMMGPEGAKVEAHCVWLELVDREVDLYVDAMFFDHEHIINQLTVLAANNMIGNIDPSQTYHRVKSIRKYFALLYKEICHINMIGLDELRTIVAEVWKRQTRKTQIAWSGSKFLFDHKSYETIRTTMLKKKLVELEDSLLKQIEEKDEIFSIKIAS